MTQDHKAITFAMTAHGVPQPVIDDVLDHGVRGSVHTAYAVGFMVLLLACIDAPFNAGPGTSVTPCTQSASPPCAP